MHVFLCYHGILQNQDRKFIRNYSKLTPMKRMMKKDELNNLTDYLCSEQSSYVTGAAIVVDGGYTVSGTRQFTLIFGAKWIARYFVRFMTPALETQYPTSLCDPP